MTLRDDEKDVSSNGAVAVQETGVLGNITPNTINSSPPSVLNTAQDVELGDEEKDYGPPPDGGLTAWLQVLATHLINAMTWGYAAAFGVYQLYYVETLGLPASQVSWIGSVQIFFTYAICAVSGRLADAGYTRTTVAVGTFLAVFGTFMTSLAKTYWQIFLAQAVCIGIGLGVTFMPAISILSSYFEKNRAFALAVSAVGTSVGSTSFPAMIQHLTAKIGFPWAVRCAGFLALVMAVIANLLLKPRLPPRKSGPLLELKAFSELPYLLFSMAAFVYFYALYFVFFYVRKRNSIRRVFLFVSLCEEEKVIVKLKKAKRALKNIVVNPFSRLTVTPVTSLAFQTVIPSIYSSSRMPWASLCGQLRATSQTDGLGQSTSLLPLSRRCSL